MSGSAHIFGRYGNVFLTEAEVAELQADFPTAWQEYIERLSEYIASTGKTYKNHTATIRRWATEDRRLSAPVIKCKKTPRKTCRIVSEEEKKDKLPTGHKRARKGSQKMKGAQWMDIRSDRQKGLSYVELGRKYHMDPRTAKRYAESPQKPEYTLSEPKPTKMEPYKQIVDEWLEEAPYSAPRILEKLGEMGFDEGCSIVKAYVSRRKMDLNGQALAWCNKVNGKVHATTSEIPFERLKKEDLNPLSREYIIDKINLRRVQKDCLISYAGNQYSVPAEYIGKDVAAAALDSMLAACYEGKQIALHRISYQRKDMVVNPQHYRRLTLKQTIDAENVLMEQGKVIDFPLKPSDLSRYDEVLYE